MSIIGVPVAIPSLPSAVLPLTGAELVPLSQNGITVETSVTNVVAAAAGSVTSVFGRIGAVTATSGDYTAAQITGLGTAATKASSSAAATTLAAISGAITVGHLATFADTAGTLQDGGAALTTPVSLTNGGTNAALTANVGGIVYSGAGALAILAGTATANQTLLSGASAAPAWSTATYPATVTVNRLLWASAANTIGDLATGNSGVLITSAGGVPSISSTIPNATQDNITRTGTLVSGATGAGYTLALGTSTITGTLLGTNGGTGVANTGKTITLGGNLTLSGAFATTLTVTNTTSVTLPTSGTLLAAAVTSVATNNGLTGGTITSTGTIGLASVADKSILANISGGSTFPSANTLTAIIDAVISSTQGTVLYRGAAVWSALATGTSGQFLQTQGAGANPVWATASGGGFTRTLYNSNENVTIATNVPFIAFLIAAGAGGGNGGGVAGVSGGGGGGGGAGEIQMITGVGDNTAHALVCGAGGAANTDGSNSTWNGYTATGGKKGANATATGGGNGGTGSAGGGAGGGTTGGGTGGAGHGLGNGSTKSLGSGTGGASAGAAGTVNASFSTILAFANMKSTDETGSLAGAGDTGGATTGGGGGGGVGGGGGGGATAQVGGFGGIPGSLPGALTGGSSGAQNAVGITGGAGDDGTLFATAGTGNSGGAGGTNEAGGGGAGSTRLMLPDAGGTGDGGGGGGSIAGTGAAGTAGGMLVYTFVAGS